MRLGADRQWPPYHLLEDDIEATAARRLEKLERLYHKGQELAWDGKTVLADLIAKHGPPRLPDDKRDSALKMLSVLLWGELAAWAISADLAERIDDVEAKMAATSQAHDEARHFYVLRDYLKATGYPVPRLGGIARRLLTKILGTDNIVHKLVGMQMLVESNALGIFRGLVNAQLEPVLCELLPYYEKDEARHVGLGTLYLPRLLANLSRFEALGVVAFQLRCIGMLMSGGMTMRQDFVNLGFDARKVAEYTAELQDQIVRDMFKTEKGGARGLLNPAVGAGPWILDFVHPPRGVESAPAWQKAALAAWGKAARLADRALA